MVRDKNEIVKPHHDEKLVPNYVLPDPLTLNNGKPVQLNQWSERRQEILELFREYTYGNQPNITLESKIQIIREVPIDGISGGIRRDFKIIYGNDEHIIHVSLYLPSSKYLPAPAFTGLNFQGNHTVHFDPSIDIPTYFVGDRPDLGSHGNVASSDSRGMHASCWPVELILSQGYALATAHYFEIAPDHVGHYESGLQRLEKKVEGQLSSRAIATWAWGYSKIREAIINFDEIDPDRIATIGHSRLGKTALWAAAEDTNFALSVSIQSGLNGAKLSRRCFGARIEHCLEKFPYWLVPKIKEFIEKESELPIDQHELLGLIAPRPVYVASAKEDWWCDPKGEFLSCLAANSIYDLFGKTGMDESEFPELNKSVGETIGYHIRPGNHAVEPIDWWHILKFADKHFKNNEG